MTFSPADLGYIDEPCVSCGMPVGYGEGRDGLCSKYEGERIDDDIPPPSPRLDGADECL